MSDALIILSKELLGGRYSSDLTILGYRKYRMAIQASEKLLEPSLVCHLNKMYDTMSTHNMIGRRRCCWSRRTLLWWRIWCKRFWSRENWLWIHMQVVWRVSGLVHKVKKRCTAITLDVTKMFDAWANLCEAYWRGMRLSCLKWLSDLAWCWKVDGVRTCLFGGHNSRRELLNAVSAIQTALYPGAPGARPASIFHKDYSLCNVARHIRYMMRSET